MLEKIGLPAKPSLRGNNWVVDATHCQGCSAQFTFINRKHHCRRCGGLFCNSCTQHRMVLRGQGDSAVRICEPCKKLEEAARFELRHGHRSKAGKASDPGSLKSTSSNVDEVLNQLLANDSKDSLHTGSGKEIAHPDEDEVLPRNAFDGVDREMGSMTPEELRQQSLDEKNKYKILKGEGKSAEALKAFKRAKELERQASALELQLRKNRKKALASSSVAESQKNEDISPEASSRVKSSHQKVKEKDDLTAELRELGWSFVDINDAEEKPAAMSLEGELLNQMRHESGKAGGNKVSSSVDKSQVVAIKKKALALKREGNLAEAKEELKRAKILEKQLEEQELLADAEVSDDELSALMHSLDDDKQKDISVGFDLHSGFDLDLSNYGGDFNPDGNFEITDDDMHDPEIAAALQSLGWDEEPMQRAADVPVSAPIKEAPLMVRYLKKEAVTQKRAGNMADAMLLLKSAKALEKDLDSLDTVGSHVDEKAFESSSVNARTAGTVARKERKPARKSRIMIQKELLALKKKALALRREGKLEEAEEELKKGKVLEQQLEEMDNAPKTDAQINAAYETSEQANHPLDLSTAVAPAVEEADVTDQDLHDPAYLSVLRSFGWQEEDNKATMLSTEAAQKNDEASGENSDTSSATIAIGKPRRSKAEIQRELLGLKRKALALRRQGQETEAEEVLEAAKALEEQMAEMEASKTEVLPNIYEDKSEVEAPKQDDLPEINHPEQRAAAQTPLKRPAEANGNSEKRQLMHAAAHEANPSPTVSSNSQKSPPQQEILAHKRKALALKREGKLAEAREELRKAKLLERNLEENKPRITDGSITMDVTSSPSSSSVREEQSPLTSASQKEQPSPSPPKPMSSHERFKLQRECLAHKRNALKLRREGRTEEADAELELAKKLEAQLEEVGPHDSTAPTSGGVGRAEDASVEDFLDPQLLSALKAIGLQDAAIVSQTPVQPEISRPSSTKNDSPSQERVQLEAQIKVEKMKALNLKRAGRQAEALDALRLAKQMEKKLNTLNV
ncbi:hypothetical protein Cgig2_004263 [Carnegiea gigantea]|uniref:FYVE-type domain-containing protein n=1 Tax=Carnegiea gigantea TaxID=171969 RepID=A0A9Q1KHQ7_9CARY|nr:hypothetical protein Cgig2_004263 [Carnegiea gigantea]